MFTTKDLMKRYRVSRPTIAHWYAKRIIPEPLRIGTNLRWREEDIEAWENFLQARVDVRAEGENPDAPTGPAPPVYSTGCVTFDPRAAAARIEERDRATRSKTLRAAMPTGGTAEDKAAAAAAGSAETTIADQAPQKATED